MWHHSLMARPHLARVCAHYNRHHIIKVLGEGSISSHIQEGTILHPPGAPDGGPKFKSNPVTQQPPCKVTHGARRDGNLDRQTSDVTKRHCGSGRRGTTTKCRVWATGDRERERGGWTTGDSTNTRMVTEDGARHHGRPPPSTSMFPAPNKSRSIHIQPSASPSHGRPPGAHVYRVANNHIHTLWRRHPCRCRACSIAAQHGDVALPLGAACKQQAGMVAQAVGGLDRLTPAQDSSSRQYTTSTTTACRCYNTESDGGSPGIVHTTVPVTHMHHVAEQPPSQQPSRWIIILLAPHMEAAPHNGSLEPLAHSTMV